MLLFPSGFTLNKSTALCHLIVTITDMLTSSNIGPILALCSNSKNTHRQLERQAFHPSLSACHLLNYTQECSGIYSTSEKLEGNNSLQEPRELWEKGACVMLDSVEIGSLVHLTQGI